ncbi:MAG: hypothetical protein II982_00095, partial [Clostridia bacterium]|nr:hypothetical protein [Clostridia bacterium]
MSQVDIVQKEGVSVYIPYIAIVGMEKETLLTAEKYDVKLSPCRFGEFSYGGFIQTLREGMTRFDGVIFSTTFDQILTEGFNFVKKMIALGVRRMLILCEPFSDPMDEYSFIDIMKDIGSYLQEIGIPTDRFSHIVCEVKEHGMNEDYLNGMRELYQQINDKIILPASEIKPFLMPIDDVIS